MNALIESFKEIDLISNIKGLTLDLEKATPTEINLFIGALTGRIPLEDIFRGHLYSVEDFCLTHYGHSGKTVVIPDYYHNHTEAHLLFARHNITVISDNGNSGYRGAKMMVDERNEVVMDGKYISASSTSMYLNRAGLETLVKVLEIDYMDKLVKIHELM